MAEKDMIHVESEHRGNEIGIDIMSDSLTVCSVDKNDMEINHQVYRTM